MIQLFSLVADGMKAADVATKNVVCCTENQTLERAIELMTEIGGTRKGFRLLPVVKGEGIVGVVSILDVLRLLAGGKKEGLEGLDMPVRGVMQKRVQAIRHDTPVSKVLENMKRDGKGVYPVLDGPRVVGMLSEHDFVMRIHEPTGIAVEEVMSRGVMTVRPQWPISDVAKMMVNTGFRRFLVAEKKIPLGIVTPSDILRYLKGKNRLGSLKSEIAPIERAMNRTIQAVRPEKDVFEAVKLMRQGGYGGLPVASSPVLEGIITERDILYAISER